MPSRPAELTQATVGTIVGAVLIIAGVFFDTSRITPEVVGAIILIVSYVAAAVTWYVARKQRTVTSTLTSGKDGTVID